MFQVLKRAKALGSAAGRLGSHSPFIVGFQDVLSVNSRDGGVG